jgi:phosphoketolase
MSLVHLMQTAISTEPDTVSSNPLSSEELRKINAYWRAANYLMIYICGPGHGGPGNSFLHAYGAVFDNEIAGPTVLARISEDGLATL